MTTFEKGSLTIDGDTLHLSMPFTKVNREKRTVSGYATLDNIDTEGDVVTAEASAKAFKRARGNLREMHDKIAAGRVVDWKESEYLDQDTGELYRGIYVTAYVSKGAEPTWEKVLDGTLSGFSIGGEIREASNEFVKDAGRTVRFIKDYDLTELSLVDNPANQLASIDSFSKSVFSINKSASGSVTDVTGLVAETKIDTVFICKDDSTVLVLAADAAECPVCETKMENAGWFEAGVGSRAEKVRDIVSKFFTTSETEAAPEVANSEGGVNMSDNKPVPEGTPTQFVNPSEEFPDGEKVDDAVKEAEEANAAVDETAGTVEEEPASPSEVQDDETEISKKITELHDAVKNSLDQSRTEHIESVKALEKQIEGIKEQFTEETSDLRDKLSKVVENLTATKNKTAELEKSLSRINDSEAFRKSADLEEEPAEKSEQESVWKGAFSGKRFSIDNHI